MMVGRAKLRTALQLNARPFTVSGGVAFVYGDIGYLLADGTVRLGISTSQVPAECRVMCVASGGVADGARGLFVRGPVDVPNFPTVGTPNALGYIDKVAGKTTATPPDYTDGDRWIKITGYWTETDVYHFSPSIIVAATELYAP